MEVMKRLALLLWAPALLSAADLSGVRSVYLMPMFRGLDQYLANTMTNHHVFQVVNDPKFADTFFTDRIGETLEMQIARLLPPEKPAEPEKEPVEKVKASAKDKAAAEVEIQGPMFGDTVNKLENPALNSSFGRGKGTVFLVDVKSRQVIWSTYSPAESSAGKHMDRTASDIVSR